MEVGAQFHPFGPLPPPDHAYGICKTKDSNDNVAAVINHWKGFDQDDQLQKHTKEKRKQDYKKMNMAALNAGISATKDWNKFCKKQNQDNLYPLLLEDTQQSSLAHRKIRFPERIERERSRPDQIPRLLSNDYGREWFLREMATRHHELNVAQTDTRMLRVKLSSVMDIHHAFRKKTIGKRNVERQRRLLHPLISLAEINPPKKILKIKSCLSTFRKGDQHRKVWRPQMQASPSWDQALNTIFCRAKKGMQCIPNVK